MLEKDSYSLVVEKIGKKYENRPVLREVSLSLRKGEAVGLLGPNGAGKTTSFYLISGLIRADYGKIFIDGIDVTHLPMHIRAKLGLGYLPQESSIFRGLTVEENILAVLEVVEKSLEERLKILDELLAEFSISHLRNSPALSLSGGERRRVEIARALACKPKYILFDEPLAGIDPIAVSEIRELISHLKDKGIGILITDHNVRDAMLIIDKAYIIHDGKVLMQGTPKEIIENAEVRKVYLGKEFEYSKINNGN